MIEVNLALIGCGPHAKRIYLPALMKLRKLCKVNLVLAVDLTSAQDAVEAAVANSGFTPEILLTTPFRGPLPQELDRRLSALVERKEINGVIIATEPLVHKAYATWALRHGLNILIDKPITARADSASVMSSADGILQDYEELLRAYQDLQQRRETVFVVNSQRRFHPGFLLVERLLSEIGRMTNCPVTSIQSYHSDGQWRFPSEIVTQTYHPYCQGYGKASHSGYHIFDMLYRMYIASGVEAKRADSMEIVSSFVQPNGFIKQLSESDYQALFDGRYDSVKRWSDAELQDICRNFGEIDVSALITLKKQKDTIANLSVNLLHNGFAKRSWLTPGADLYKGNGRVKHEHHNFQQGPFQNIQIHSYQSNDRHDASDASQDLLGGDNHFDIYVFRNPLVSGTQPTMRVYRLTDVLAETKQDDYGMLTSEFAKHRVVEDFVNYIGGTRQKCALASQIEDHLVPVQIMSSIYRSHILRSQGDDCVVRQPFGQANRPFQAPIPIGSRSCSRVPTPISTECA